MLTLFQPSTPTVKLQDHLQKLTQVYSKLAENVECYREEADFQEIERLTDQIPKLSESKTLAKCLKDKIDRTLVKHKEQLDTLADQIQPIVCGFLRLLQVVYSRSEKFAGLLKQILEAGLEKQYQQIRAMFRKLRLSSPAHIFNDDTKAYRILERIFDSLKGQYILPQQTINKRIDFKRDKLIEIMEFEGFFSQFRNLKEAITTYLPSHNDDKD